MRQIYKLVPLALMVAALLCTTRTVQAQQGDTLLVPWLINDDLAVNSLYNAVVGDTLANGQRANLNRVYKLERGGFYYLTERIENNGWHLRIVGEKGDPTDPFENPPMIQLEHRGDGSRTDKILVAGGDVTLKNLIINGKTTLGDLPYEIVRFDRADGVTTIDNVTFEYAAWGIIAFYGPGSEIYVTNSRFRNLQSNNQFWGGRAMSIWTDVKKIFIENNTFMNIGGFGIQLEGGVADEFWINHNTFVNIGRQTILHPWHKNTYFTNNLIVNGWWHGEGEEGFNSVRLGEADNQYTGDFYLTTIPSRYGLDVERTVIFAKNATFRQDVFENYYASTSGASFPLRSQPALNVRTRNFFDTYDNMVLQDLIEGVNPGLAVMPDNQAQMIAFVTAIRANAETRPSWTWDPGREQSNLSIQWPFPEDFTYSNTTLRSAGFGGFPLGDLNWYPDRKAQWMTQRDALAQQIKDLAGEPPVLTLIADIEGEDGTLGGNAEVVQMQDRLVARVAGSGEPRWEFDMPTAGAFNVTIKHRTWYPDTNPNRETRLMVNGTEAARFTLGRDITADLPWAEAVVENVNFQQGANTIRLARSWGYMEYESVIIRDGNGNVVRSLYASKADLNGSDILCGGTLCASGDAYADLRTGTLSMQVNAASAGQHVVKLTYLIPEGSDATADIRINGDLAATVNLAGSSTAFASTTLSANMVAGNNTIEITNVTGRLGIDVVEVFSLGTGTSTDPNELPAGFALEQNYPNPFNPVTTINYTVGQAGSVRIIVFDILGRQVATLVDTNLPAGVHQVTWDARTATGEMAGSGVYFYRFDTPVGSATRSMVLVK